MIKELFLPRYFQGYYLFPTRIVGFDISKTHVCATQLYLNGRSTKVEKYIELPLESGSSANYDERLVKTLKDVVAQLDAYDFVHTALPSSVVVFKELRIPFLTYETIKKVVNYEVEPLLPFALSEAVIEFVITKEHIAQSSSEIVVAAVQNQYIAQHLQLLAQAGIDPNVVTIDFFALYALMKKSPIYASMPGGVMLVDLDMQLTRIAYIQDGQLRFIRTLGKGIYQQAKDASQALGMQPTELIEHLMRFGLENHSNPRYTQALIEAFSTFWREIQFTLQSFTAQMQQQPPLKIILLGQGADLKGMVNFVHDQLQMPCQIINPTDLVGSANITIKTKSALPSSSIISLAAALVQPTPDSVNLRQGDFEPSTNSILSKQLIVAGGLLVMLIVSLITFSFLQLRTMRQEAQASQREALDALTENPDFEKVLKEGLKGVKEKNMLEEAKDLSTEEVKKREEMWFAFAGSARGSILKYLLELTNKIDKDALGFNLESLTFSPGTMTIKAQVKDHEALKLLERTLDESPLFRPVPKQEETNFTMKITLSKNGEEK